MEGTKFPVVIKKRNGAMIGVSILEIVIGIIFGITEDGLKNIILWIFAFTGIVTALSVLVEYSQDILIKDNKLEFYKNKALMKTINYSDIKSMSMDKSNEPKTKKKNFLTISIGINDNKSNKNKNYKVEKYQINHTNYSTKDLITIKNIIVSKNSYVKISSEVNELFMNTDKSK